MEKDELRKIMEVEGDFEEFEFLGFECYAVRNCVGSWDGYVKIPKEHVAYGKSYEDKDLSSIKVHGGLTYSDYRLPRCDEIKGYFLGFDCLHFDDLIPYRFLTYDEHLLGKGICTYKSKEYVRGELYKLAKQLKGLDKEREINTETNKKVDISLEEKMKETYAMVDKFCSMISIVCSEVDILISLLKEIHDEPDVSNK